MTILIDTNVFISFYNVDDVNHEKAVKIMSDIDVGTYGVPFISDYIFDEVVTVTSMKVKKKELALRLGDQLLASFHMLMVKEDIFKRAWDAFKLTDAGLSFTDVTNVVLTEMLPEKRIATFDKGFKKFAELEIIDG
jgi:predicted nucleic acid-binding protein